MMSKQPNKAGAKDSELIRKFILDIGLPLNQAPDALGLTPKEFLNWWSNPEKIKLAQRSLIRLSSFLKIDGDQVINQSYNKDLVRANLFGANAELPSRYSLNRYSHLRSSAHIAKYIALTRGQHFCDKIMTSLGVPLVLYSDLDATISLNYFIDLLDTLAKNGFSESEIDSLACLLFLGIEQTELGKKFATAKSYAECYEVLATNIFLFDSNFVYTSDLDATQYVLKAYLPYDRHYHFNWNQISITRLLRYRQTLMGWFPYLSRLTPIRPTVEIEYLSTGIQATYTAKFSHLTLTKPFFAAAAARR
jgi:hypothetical protein